MAGLGGLAKKEDKAKNDNRNKAATEDLAALETGADFTAKTQSKAVFKRLTFSLTEEVSEDIDALTLRVRTKRINRSDVVKLGVQMLNKLSDDELNKIIT